MGVGDGQGGLASCSSWGCKESDSTERLNWTDLIQRGGLPWWFRWWRIHPQCKRYGFNPWVRNIPWRREWQPTSVFLLGESHGQRSLAGYSPWRQKEWCSPMTGWLIHRHTEGWSGSPDSSAHCSALTSLQGNSQAWDPCFQEQPCRIPSSLPNLCSNKLCDIADTDGTAKHRLCPQKLMGNLSQKLNISSCRFPFSLFPIQILLLLLKVLDLNVPF